MAEAPQLSNQQVIIIYVSYQLLLVFWLFACYFHCSFFNIFAHLCLISGFFALCKYYFGFLLVGMSWHIPRDTSSLAVDEIKDFPQKRISAQVFFSGLLSTILVCFLLFLIVLLNKSFLCGFLCFLIFAVSIIHLAIFIKLQNIVSKKSTDAIRSALLGVEDHFSSASEGSEEVEEEYEQQ